MIHKVHKHSQTPAGLRTLEIFTLLVILAQINRMEWTENLSGNIQQFRNMFIHGDITYRVSVRLQGCHFHWILGSGFPLAVQWILCLLLNSTLTTLSKSVSFS